MFFATFQMSGFFVVDFLGIFGFFIIFSLSKLLRLLLKVTKVTNEHQKWPKMGKNSIICPFFGRREKSLGRMLKLSAGLVRVYLGGLVIR